MRNKIFNAVGIIFLIVLFMITVLSYSLFLEKIIPHKLDTLLISDGEGFRLSLIISGFLTLVLFAAAYAGIKYTFGGYKTYNKNILLIDKYFSILNKVDSMEKITNLIHSGQFDHFFINESEAYKKTELLSINLFLKSVYEKNK